MSVTIDEEMGGALVEATVENSRLPPQTTRYRCIYCNLEMVVVGHDDCDCDPEWCPNGCEHERGDDE